MARPAIAEYRITKYDGKYVTFWYENKKPKKKIEVTMTAINFIGKLVNHIHPKGFRVVRRYGLYSRKKHKLSIEIIKLYNFIKQRDINEIINTVKNRNKSFRDRLIETFGVNPFICSKCGEEMILWEIWMPKYGKIYDVLDKSNYRTVVNEETYENKNKKEKINIYNYEQMCLF